MKVRMKVDTYRMVCDIIDYAIERGMDRHDKYSSTPLSEESRGLLRREVEASFWLGASDRNVEFY